VEELAKQGGQGSHTLRSSKISAASAMQTLQHQQAIRKRRVRTGKSEILRLNQDCLQQ
jgi:hypothetical protein